MSTKEKFFCHSCKQWVERYVTSLDNERCDFCSRPMLEIMQYKHSQETNAKRIRLAAQKANRQLKKMEERNAG